MARYLENLFRYWKRFAVILVLLPIPISMATLIYFRTYQASTDLWVEQPTYFGSNANVVGSNGVSGWNQYLTPAQNQADELDQYLQTTSFLYAVGDQMGKDGYSDVKERNTLILSIPKTMHVTPNGSHLLTITFSCDRASYCTETLSATIYIFQQRLTSALRDQEQLSESFLQAQVADAQKKADASATALDTYLAHHPGSPITTNANTGIPELDKLINQAQNDENQLIALEGQLGQAQYTFAAADKFVQTSTKVVDDPGITAGGFLGDRSSLKRAAVVWLAALGVAAVYLALLVWMDKTARDSRELASHLAVPVLTTVPLLPARERF